MKKIKEPFGLLLPKEIIIPGGYPLPPTVRIVIAQNYGGDLAIRKDFKNFLMFNVSPIELWLNGKKYEEFKPLVYHFEGRVSE